MTDERSENCEMVSIAAYISQHFVRWLSMPFRNNSLSFLQAYQDLLDKSHKSLCGGNVADTQRGSLSRCFLLSFASLPRWSANLPQYHPLRRYCCLPRVMMKFFVGVFDLKNRITMFLALAGSCLRPWFVHPDVGGVRFLGSAIQLQAPRPPCFMTDWRLCHHGTVSVAPYT